MIEVGYGFGGFSCRLAARYGWRMVGYEIRTDVQEQARRRAVECGVEHLVEFRVVKPDEMWKLGGEYDGVFIKQVLHCAASLGQRAEWLDWVLSVLRPGGTFLNFENGRCNAVTRLYRRLRKRWYRNSCLYCRAVEQLYRERFSDLRIAYGGGVSQFLTSVPILFYPFVFVEERILRRNADNSFCVSIVARKGAATC